MTDIYPTLEDTCTHILELFLPRDWYSNIYYGSEQAEMVYQNWMHAHSLDETAINVALDAFEKLEATSEQTQLLNS